MGWGGGGKRGREEGEKERKALLSFPLLPPPLASSLPLERPNTQVARSETAMKWIFIISSNLLEILLPRDASTRGRRFTHARSDTLPPSTIADKNVPTRRALFIFQSWPARPVSS